MKNMTYQSQLVQNRLAQLRQLLERLLCQRLQNLPAQLLQCLHFRPELKPVIEDADVAIGNLEVTLGGKPYAGYPQFRAPDEYLQAIVDAGIDIILTANNHCLDSGKHGLERTIMMMDCLSCLLDCTTLSLLLSIL